MSAKNKNLSAYAPLALRAGLFVVFALFGLQKLSNPSQSASEIQLLMNWNIGNAAAMNYYLGLIEIILAISFFIGFKVKITSLAASGLLILFFSSFLFKYGLSINPNLYRDIGLLGATLALFLWGAGPISIDRRRASLEINQKNTNDK